MNRPQRLQNNAIRFVCLLAAVLATALSLRAQSLDPNAPAPVRSNTVNGRIPARDLGDSRLTDHYYAFTGTPGDLIITVQGQNLNGDVDVFTAGTLRPLIKMTLYAEISAPVTKGIYLRKREDLILRIEARSPNDDDGTYRLFFGGSFEPIAGGPDVAENETPTPTTETPAGGRRTKRVNSVGATISEPEPPVTEAAATPTPEAKPIESPTPAEKPAETADAAKPAAPAGAPRSRKAPPRRVGTTARARRPAPKTTPAREPSETAGTTEPATTKEPARSPAETPAAEPQPEVGPRLVIETTDGTLINRAMSGVRRVTVENGQVVVVGKDGKIDRILLANVVRMSIAP
jgi:hypothetical protein